MNQLQSKSLSSQLLDFVKSEKSELGAIIVVGLAVTIMFLAVPLGVQSIVNSSITGVFASPTLFLVIAILIAVGIASWLGAIQLLAIERIQQRIMVKKSLEVTRSILNRDASTQIHQRDLHRFYDLFSLQKALSVILIDGITVLIQLLVGFILVSFYHSFLLAVSIIIVITSYYILTKMTPKALKSAKAESDMKFEFGDWLFSLVENKDWLQAANLKSYVMLKTDQKLNRYLDARDEHFRIFFKQVVGFILIQVISSGALMAVGTYLIAVNRLSIGQFVASEILLTVINTSLWKLQKHLAAFYDLSVAVHKIESLIDGTKDFDSARISESVLDKIEIFQNEKPISSLAPGQSLLLFGGPSSGKTKMARALLGLKDYEDIRVELNELPATHQDSYHLFRDFYLLKESQWLSETIKENLLLGDVDKSPQLSAMLKDFKLERFIDHPELLEQSFSNCTGITDSQLRILNLIRGLLLKPKLLVIDGFFDDWALEDLKTLNRVLAKNLGKTILVVTTTDPMIAEQIKVDQMLIAKEGQWLTGSLKN